ncbi:transcription factor bHLH30-like [Lycium ferocissimum]|uniref:transcription factor bHLH30-like n=1 Tax=Lycium ferocissimum TaxID=112874 RepID=UPI002815E823|nr:transcription factor bHLH30-like [Lycium ferocissimum]
MYQIPSFYELGSTCSDSYNNFLHGIINSSSGEMFNNVESSSVSPRSMAEAKAIAANKSHSEAERRRRKRINGHLATLRTLLPNTVKTDKASLLAEAVRCVRELKKTTSELGASTMSDDDDNDDDHTTLVKKLMFPSESDELNISYCNNSSDSDGTLIIKASMCCEDRPEIMTDLRRALSTVQGKVVRAEMSTVGGRIKCVLWLEMLENECKEGLLVQLRRALKVVMDKANFGPQNMGQDLLGNKRPRLLGGPMNYV